MTGAGWCCIWDPAAFTHITDEDAHFDALIDEDGLARTIAAGRIVPINDEADGGYDIGIRVVDDASAPPEADCATEVSQPYKLLTTGEICVSGMEFVGHPTDSTVHRLTIPSGKYVATVYNLDDGTGDSRQFLAVLRLVRDGEEIDFCDHDDTFCRNPRVLPSGHVGFRVETCDNWRQLKTDTMAVTGHDKIAVSVAYKEHVPLYLGNGHQDPLRIHESVPALIKVAENLNCQYYFVLDDARVEVDQLLNAFAK
jgi:hypothetical protein